MSSDGGSIQLEGLPELLKALAKCDRDIIDEALNGLATGGAEIIKDAKLNLTNNGSVVTGLLRESGHVIRKGDDITAGFFDTKNQSGYAMYVEYGRRSGKMPPVETLEAWVYKRFQLKDWKAARAAAWAMARTIAKEGTKPHPFFGPAIKKNFRKIINAVRNAVRKKIK